MYKTRLIRIKNTLLAASGGLLLSLELIFAHTFGYSTISTGHLVLCLSAFWFVNFAIIVAIVSGVTERFNDPSLSLFQMYWAVITSLCCILIMPRYAHFIYLLIFVIGIFGVFRLRPKAFNRYAIFQSFGLALVLYTLYILNWTNFSALELFATWLVYICCMSILISLCRSMSILRDKLKSRNLQLQEALSAKSHFLANMSHEIRTPMNGVLGMLALIDNSELDENQRRYVGVAQSSGQSLLILINEILDYSKIEANKLQLSPVRFNLKNAVFDFVQSFYFLAKNKGIDLIVDINPRIPDLIVADNERIRQVLNNIVGNAVKFTEEGEIKVILDFDEKESIIASGAELKENEIKLCFSIVDTGVGIDSEAQKKIFESFSQADSSTTRNFGGTGLGLAISKKLCELMGGDITVASDHSSGSVFKFSLVVSVESAFETLVQHETDSQERPLQGVKVLVVDTNEHRASVIFNCAVYYGADVELMCSNKVDIGELVHVVSIKNISHVICHESVVDFRGEKVVTKLSNLGGSRAFPLISYGANDVTAAEHAAHRVGHPRHLFEPASYEAILSVLTPPPNNESTSMGASMMLEKNDTSIFRVLLVEDNETNQEVASMIIEECGSVVVVAEDGLEALNILKSGGEFDLIFMDCQMPRLDGYATTKSIRSGDLGAAIAQLPIVAMTANALVGDREKCLAAGMDDYISKPISFDDIAQSIEKWCKQN